MPDLKQMDELLKLLESKRPDLYEKIDQENISEKEVMELLSEAMEPLVIDKSGDDGHTGEASGGKSGEAPTETHEEPPAESSKLAEAEEKLKKIDFQLCKGMLREALAESNLPEPVRVDTLLHCRRFDRRSGGNSCISFKYDRIERTG